MKNLIGGIFIVLFSTTFVSGQQVFNPQNARDGETIEYCHEHVQLEKIRLNEPEMYQQFLISQAQLEEETRNYVGAKSGTVYTIPVVIHILHNGGTENITDEQVYDAISILNRDFRLLNNDANNVYADFQGMPADVEIEFKLATIAPNGQCFKGITRTQSALTTAGDDGEGQLDAAFAGNDVYQGTWDHSRYLNVLVARNIGGAAGYTYRPSSWGSESVHRNSIWILHNYVGSIGTSSIYTSRTLTHEVGHWLNLMHTWGGTNNPGLIENCDTDDDVTDTPNTVGSTSCNFNENTCGSRANVENYMDYSYCSKMFTPGQVDRMRAAVISSTGERNNLWTTQNLNLVGAIASPPLCNADFSADKRVICAGEAVQFSDQSYNSVTDWSWTFQGGSPATSSSENPSITYSTPGIYQVSLTASNGADNEIETKTAYITVLEPGTNLPFYEGFENYTTLADAQGLWFTESSINNARFEVTNTAAHTGSKSAKLNNFSQSGENTDALVSSSIDLSNETINDVTLSFRYAYRKRVSNNQEYLRIFFSSNCGETWQVKKILNATSMSTEVVTSSWTPNQADWKTLHLPFNNSTYSQYLVDNFRYKFSFDGNGGNNFYIDDINIYNGPESNDIVLGIEEKEGMNNISLFPNPNEGEATISFSLENAQAVTLTITDISGKELKSTTLQGNVGENAILIDGSDFTSGLYFIQLGTGSSNKTLRFIKK